MKFIFRLRTLVVILSLIVSSNTLANSSTEEALQLLRNMTKSFSVLSYDGVFVHSESTRMNSMRVRHDSMEGVEYESLIDLDGDKIEVLRVDDKIICVYPNKQVANMQAPLEPPFQRFKEVESDRLRKGYEMRVEPHSQRIAGREAIVIKLTSKDAYRYSHEFWLDKENHFLLKHDVVQTNGELLERIQFASINFTPDLKKEDFIPKKGSYSEPITESQLRFIKSLWQFDWLPEGFSLVWSEAKALNHGTSMLLLSDGMVTVSVFVEPTMQDKKMSLLSMGATIAGERSFKVKDQFYLLTIVGEVPEATIEKLMSVLMPRFKND